MEIKATQRAIRQAPRKVRLVANAVKELGLEQAIRQLAVMRRAATLPVLKTLRQAVANAQHNHGLSPANLRIKELLVNDGASLKRWRAVSRGRSHAVSKKTCHVLVTLETIESIDRVPPAATKVKQPKATTAVVAATSESKTVTKAKVTVPPKKTSSKKVEK